MVDRLIGSTRLGTVDNRSALTQIHNRYSVRDPYMDEQLPTYPIYRAARLSVSTALIVVVVLERHVPLLSKDVFDILRSRLGWWTFASEPLDPANQRRV